MKRIIALIVTVTAAAGAMMAQAPSEASLGIAEKLRQNSEALKLYTHERRTQIEIKGKSRGARTDHVRYVDGKIETVPVEAAPRPEQAARRGGLRGKLIEKQIEKKKEEVKDDVERLTALLQRYLSPGLDSVGTLIEKATISRTGPEPDADVKLVATGLLNPSDRFTLIWSVADKRPVRIEIDAEFENKPVRVSVDYDTVPDGPFYAGHTVISAPAKEITVDIETSDYMLSEPK